MVTAGHRAEDGPFFELRRFKALDATLFRPKDRKLLPRTQRAVTDRAQVREIAKGEKCERGDLNPKRRLK